MDKNLTAKMELAIKKTLAYGSIFSYPYKKEEIWKWLLWEERKPPDKKEFEKVLSKMPLLKIDGFYTFPKKEDFIQKRTRRSYYSQQKIAIAQNAASFLKKIPTIKFIGISGALAVANAEKDDDIDIFIIAQKNTLWLTRLLATLSLDFKKTRRKPDDKKTKDKICLNMFLDETNLNAASGQENIYIAHEICQLVPLYEKDDAYFKMLKANFWINNLLPNAIDRSALKHKTPPPSPWSSFFFPLELLAKFLQIFYMKKRITKEIVNSKQIKFHPHDQSGYVLEKYRCLKKKLEK